MSRGPRIRFPVPAKIDPTRDPATTPDEAPFEIKEGGSLALHQGLSSLVRRTTHDGHDITSATGYPGDDDAL